MYVFSANATARGTQSGVPEGRRMHFMVYINFQDAFGAEQLCKLYLLRAGFKDVDIEKRQFMAPATLRDESLLQADQALRQALDSGYMVRMFEDDDGLH